MSRVACSDEHEYVSMSMSMFRCSRSSAGTATAGAWLGAAAQLQSSLLPAALPVLADIQETAACLSAGPVSPLLLTKHTAAIHPAR